MSVQPNVFRRTVHFDRTCSQPVLPTRWPTRERINVCRTAPTGPVPERPTQNTHNAKRNFKYLPLAFLDLSTFSDTTLRAQYACLFWLEHSAHVHVRPVVGMQHSPMQIHMNHVCSCRMFDHARQHQVGLDTIIPPCPPCRIHSRMLPPQRNACYMPCKMGTRKRAWKLRDTVASENASPRKKTNYACTVEAHESTKRRLESGPSPSKNHEDQIAEKGFLIH